MQIEHERRVRSRVEACEPIVTRDETRKRNAYRSMGDARNARIRGGAAAGVGGDHDAHDFGSRGVVTQRNRPLMMHTDGYALIHRTTCARLSIIPLIWTVLSSSW